MSQVSAQPPNARRTTWLPEMMSELAEIDREAAEENLPKVDSQAKDETVRILIQLSKSASVSPTIFPTMDGGIAIQFNAPSAPRAVLIELGNDGEATCFATIDGRNQMLRYESTSGLPDEFLEMQLSLLTP